jgi:hypothetical protein
MAAGTICETGETDETGENAFVTAPFGIPCLFANFRATIHPS